MRQEAIAFDKKYLKALLLLIPSIAVFLLSRVLMTTTDAIYVSTWHLTIMILGLCALPITFYFFENFSSGAYSLSKSIGILFVALFVWTCTYLKFYRTDRIFLFGAVILLLVVALSVKCFRESFLRKISEDGIFEKMLFEELLFSVVFVLLCFYKGMYPDINGQEKFMDYGFILSMLRSDTLPANDMWLSGEHINYYYFGQFIYALITKLINMTPSYAYVLSMCTSIAIPFISAFSIGKMLFELAGKRGARFPRVAKYLVGLLSGFMVVIFGNSHSFFYDEKSFGNKLLQSLSKKGKNVGDISDFFYPNSTRFIGHNPDSYVFDATTNTVVNAGDYTIHEFPFYSYLVGDLHAHVISMMVVTLIIAFCISLLSKCTHPSNNERSSIGLLTANSNFDVKINMSVFSKQSFIREIRNLLNPTLIVIGILLGIATMTNYWDFLIYFVFSAMTLLVYNTTRSKDFSTPLATILFFTDLILILGTYMSFGENVIVHCLLQVLLLLLGIICTIAAPSSLTRTSCAMNFLFAFSNIIAIPFNINFDMISNKLALCKNHTSFFQFAILWSVHIGVMLIFFVYVVFHKNYRVMVGKTRKVSLSSPSGSTSASASAASSVVVFGEPSNGYTNIISKFIGQRNLADVFVCGMGITGLLMIIAPEIFYVRDIYTGGYLRANTMFKFTFAGFIILSLVISYVAIRLLWFTNKKGQYSGAAFALGLVCLLSFMLPAHYTYVSLDQRCGGLNKANFKTLDGTAYISDYASVSLVPANKGNLTCYDECIDWFNSEVKGSPVICEAYGNSYTDYDIVSAYTGLPTIFGWQTHEWLWRFHGIVDKEKDLLVSDPEKDVFEIFINPRHADVDIVYTSANTTEIQEVLSKYNVEYVVLGPLETTKYHYDNSFYLSQVGEVVFDNQEVKVFKVN